MCLTISTIVARNQIYRSTSTSGQLDALLDIKNNEKTRDQNTASQQFTYSSLPQQSKNEQASQKKKKVAPNLKSVDPEKYPRPNLNLWELVNVDSQEIHNSPEMKAQHQPGTWQVVSVF